MNMTLVLMAKAFKLNYSTPTNNNQRISSDLVIGGWLSLNFENRVVQNAVQNLGFQNIGNYNGLIVVSEIANQNGNGNVVPARAEADLDEIEEVNANCILMANFQQASTSGTQTDKAPVYDSDGSADVHDYDNYYNSEILNMFTQEEHYTDLLEPILEPHQVQQNDSIISFAVSGVEQEGEQ
nr:hypothetical protein [Tanacetum cinerariifolium]